MPIAVVCKCGQKLKASDQLAGKTVKCPKCQQTLKVPALDPEPVIDLGSALSSELDDLFQRELADSATSSSRGAASLASPLGNPPYTGSAQRSEGFPKWMLWAGGVITVVLLLGLGIAMVVTSLKAGDKSQSVAQATDDSPRSDEVETADVASAFTTIVQPDRKMPHKPKESMPAKEQANIRDPNKTTFPATIAEEAFPPMRLTDEDTLLSESETVDDPDVDSGEASERLDGKLLQRIRDQIEKESVNLAPKLEIDSQVESELRQIFEQLAEAYRRNVQDLFDAIVDERRHAMVVIDQYLANGGILEGNDEQSITTWVSQESILATDIKTDVKFLRFNNYSLQRVELSPNKKTAAVIVYLPFKDQVSEKMRYWLRREEQGWKFFDKERLSLAMKASSLTAGTIGTPVEVRALDREFDAMRALRAAENSENEAAIKKALDRLDAVAKIKLSHFVRHQARSEWYYDKEDYHKSLFHAEQAHSIYPQSPELFLQRARTCNELEQYGTALKLALTYHKKIGPDEIYWSVIATSLDFLDYPEDAIAAWQRSLEYDPQYKDVLYLLALATLPDHPEQIKDYIAKDKVDDETFQFVTDLLEKEEFDEELAALRNIRGE